MRSSDEKNRMELSTRLESLLKRHFPEIDLGPDEDVATNGFQSDALRGEARPAVGITVELLVENHDEDDQIDRFLKNLDQLIHEVSNSYGGIISSYPLWRDKTVVTLMMEPAVIGQFVIRMACLPEVVSVEQGINSGRKMDFPDGSIGINPYPLNSVTPNRFRVIMKRPEVAGY